MIEQLDEWRGGLGTEPPWMEVILEAANRDPLRAQDIEERLSERWWKYWLESERIRIAYEQRRRKRLA